MNDPCTQLRKLIDKEFTFLLQKAKYVEIHIEAGRASGCVLILEGDRIRIRIQSTRDEELNVLVGDRSALLGWREEEGGVRVWHYLREIAGYLEGDTSIGERYAAMNREELAQARATAPRDLASILLRSLGRIEELFSDGGFDRMRDDYESYLQKVREQTRAAYGRDTQVD